MEEGTKQLNNKSHTQNFKKSRNIGFQEEETRMKTAENNAIDPEMLQEPGNTMITAETNATSKELT